MKEEEKKRRERGREERGGQRGERGGEGGGGGEERGVRGGKREREHSPTTLQPLILPICPTTDPTAPAAPVTTRVSPFLGVDKSSRPKYAVALLTVLNKKVLTCYVSDLHM